MAAPLRAATAKNEHKCNNMPTSASNLARPHSLCPSTSTVRCLIAYKTRPKAASHIGLGVSALNTSQVLRSHGFWVDVVGINSAADLEAQITARDADAIRRGQIPVSHVVVSAPWIPTTDWMRLVSGHTSIEFTELCHSNVGFLQADPNAVKLIRAGLDLQRQWHNFSVAANSRKFQEWMLRAYGADILHLPNLYNLQHDEPSMMRTRPPYTGGVLRIGSFGAIRILKNQLTACAAALEIARRLGADTEFWLSYGRLEGPGSVLASIHQMGAGVKGFTIKTNHWETWPQFTATIRHMNLLLQPSFTESFNMVTADGVSQGVPSVTGDAIEWVPPNWKAEPDNALDVANKAVGLLYDPMAAREGWKSLETHNERGLCDWKKWFKV